MSRKPQSVLQYIWDGMSPDSQDRTLATIRETGRIVTSGQLTHTCGTPVVRYPNGETFPTFYCPKCDTGIWPN